MITFQKASTSQAPDFRGKVGRIPRTTGLQSGGSQKLPFLETVHQNSPNHRTAERWFGKSFLFWKAFTRIPRTTGLQSGGFAKASFFGNCSPEFPNHRTAERWFRKSFLFWKPFTRIPRTTGLQSGGSQKLPFLETVLQSPEPTELEIA